MASRTHNKDYLLNTSAEHGGPLHHNIAGNVAEAEEAGLFF